MTTFLFLLSLLFPIPAEPQHPGIAAFQSLNPCGGGYCDAARNLSHRSFPSVGGDSTAQPEPVKRSNPTRRAGLAESQQVVVLRWLP